MANLFPSDFADTLSVEIDRPGLRLSGFKAVSKYCTVEIDQPGLSLHGCQVVSHIFTGLRLTRLV